MKNISTFFVCLFVLQVLELASDDCVDGFDDDENIYEPVSFFEQNVCEF